MLILGLNHDMYIASAALIDDGRIVAAAPEERFTRDKHSRAFPRQAIRYCLETAGATIADVDHVATAWNPGATMCKYNPLFSSHRRFKAEYLYSVPDNLLALYPPERRQVDFVHQRLAMDQGALSLYHVTHHRAHAANAFLLSPFAEAAILTADSQGELESTTLAVGRDNRIVPLAALHHPHSLGAFYATFTEYLGFKPHGDEWKVMALSAYAGAEVDGYLRIMRELVDLLPDGTFRLDLTYFKDFLHDQPDLYTARLVERFGPARRPDESLGERHFAIAAALQTVAEEIAFHLLRALHARTGLDNLCVSGGFFMNSVLNGKILANTPFRRLFVSSCPDDSGNSLGAAYYLHNHILGATTRQPLGHNYLGPAYGEAEIGDTLARYGLIAESVADVEAATAELLARGALVGWFQGRMEFGQRALGNRSILADPRDPNTRDKVNRAVKYRESFRPFAPSVPVEDARTYFELGEGIQVPFMERVCQARPETRHLMPAVVHRDGSARVQTVDANDNPRFHRLIRAFEARTGLPILLNTSFNLNGEPVVCSPTDAIRTFFSCGLDVLVMGDRILRKPGGA